MFKCQKEIILKTLKDLVEYINIELINYIEKENYYKKVAFRIAVKSVSIYNNEYFKKNTTYHIFISIEYIIRVYHLVRNYISTYAVAFSIQFMNALGTKSTAFLSISTGTFKKLHRYFVQHC